MSLKEMVKKEIDKLRIDELVLLSEQIRLLKRAKVPPGKALPVEELRRMTSTSKTNWSEAVIQEREERG